MRHRDLIPINARFFGATMRRLSFHFAAEGEGGAGAGAGGEGGAGAGGAGSGAGGEKTYTEADIAALKAKNAELIGKNKTLAERAKVIGERTPEEVMADLEFAAKAREQQARAAGDFEELKKIQAAELAKANQRIAELQTGRQNDARRRAVVEALSAVGGKVKKLQEPVLKHLKAVEEDGEIVVQVVDAKGNVRMMDGQGTPMTVAQLVEEFRADDDYANDFAASGASGSGARNESSGRGGSATVLIPANATPAEYRRLKADAEKRGVPYAIAS